MQNKGKLKMFVECLLSEEEIPDLQRQVKGISSESPPQQVNVNDLLKGQSSDDTAPELKKYPLNNFDGISADTFINIQNITSLLKSAYSNPDINDKKLIKTCLDIAKTIEDKIVDLSKNVNKIR